MTIDKKREALEEFCNGKRCSDCPLQSIIHDTCDFVEMNEREIHRIYDIAFPGTDNGIDATPHIKDSGERREFATGAVRDIQEGKGRCDLMPLDVVARQINSGEVADCVISEIFLFQLNNDVKYLYHAVEAFRNMIGYDMVTLLLEVAKHFEAGAKKYGEDNWTKGIPVKCYIDSAVRHYLRWLRGDNDEPHHRAFVWNILCCIWTCIHKPELNDYRKEN